jgi:cytochrome c556
MTYPTLWDVLEIALIVIAFFWARNFFRPYLVEKGKNLASKEDVEELTRKVEGIKTQYLGDLERLRFELGRASHIHKAQYETEVRVYGEIWPCLIDVQRTVAALRPMLDSSDAQAEAERSRRVKEFSETFNVMQNAVWKNKPFYSAEVHRELQKLSDLAIAELIDYQHGDPRSDENYWKDMIKNIRAISAQINVVCEAIRQRVSASEDTNGRSSR